MSATWRWPSRRSAPAPGAVNPALDSLIEVVETPIANSGIGLIAESGRAKLVSYKQRQVGSDGKTMTVTDTKLLRRNMSRSSAVVAVRVPAWIVDDNPDDAKLTQLAFKRLNPQFPTTVFGSGHELVAHLNGIGASLNATAMSVPCAIFLDWKMPEMDGFEVMEWLKKQPQFATIPIIVVTNFTDLPHLKQAYALGARSYLLKPINADVLRGTLASLSISVYQ
jgi:CheY-like chemotaxis protein